MPSSSHDEDAAAASGESAAAAGEDTAAVANIESRLEELAGEISRTIENGPVADREALHDYAVSLVRERLPVALADGSRGGRPAGSRAEGERTNSGSTAASLVGYGVLLIPVGFLLSLVFAPVGVLLFFGGLALIGCGLIAGLATRLGRSSRRGSA